MAKKVGAGSAKRVAKKVVKGSARRAVAGRATKGVGAGYTVVLTDTQSRVWVDALTIRAADIGREGDWWIRKQRLRGGAADGVDIVEINNGTMTLTVVPSRGMGIWKGEYRGEAIGWNSPVRGPVHPSLVNPLERGGLGWLRGFDEAIVRCGLESNGAPCRDSVTNNMGQRIETDLTLHGRIANTAAEYVAIEISGGAKPVLTVTGRVVESGLFLPNLALTARISTTAGSNCFTVDDEITNGRGVDAEMQMLYHNNFGGPFLDAGAKLEIPARLVAPRDARAAEGIDGHDDMLGPTTGYVEQCYYYDTLADSTGRTLAMLRNGAADKALVMRYRKDELPCFTHWKNTASEECGYVTGLEPGTNFPNPKPFERKQGRVVVLKPGASYRCGFSIEVVLGAGAVKRVSAEIAALQSGVKREVHRVPLRGYSDV